MFVGLHPAPKLLAVGKERDQAIVFNDLADSRKVLMALFGKLEHSPGMVMTVHDVENPVGTDENFCRLFFRVLAELLRVWSLAEYLLYVEFAYTDLCRM
jgi:hypothetical protein